ncbi:MAG: BON domain-containing protein [Ktedonobacterales bacterium]
MFSERTLYGDQPTRRLFRFGQLVAGRDIFNAATRRRLGGDGPSGKLIGARLRPSVGEVWLRLRPTDLRNRWKRLIRIVPLNGAQSAAPTPDSVELRGGMSIRCHEGYIGRLEGLVLDVQTGLAQELIVRIRGDVLADVENSTSPLYHLFNLRGQRVALSPAWAVSSARAQSSLPLKGDSYTLLLDASAEQIASATVVRGDNELAAAVWSILGENPAIAPSLGGLRVVVRDGDVTLLGTLPSIRHRASAEQDVWHVPGVLAVHNETTIGA